MADRLFCQIRLQGHLSTQWLDWFGGLAMENLLGGEALLSGELPDQAALYGVLNRVRDLGLPLISVTCETLDPGSSSVPQTDARARHTSGGDHVGDQTAKERRPGSE